MRGGGYCILMWRIIGKREGRMGGLKMKCFERFRSNYIGFYDE